MQSSQTEVPQIFRVNSLDFALDNSNGVVRMPNRNCGVKKD